MATNARQQMEALRQETTLKDEMIALGIERNAELYSIASEIVEKGISPRSMEPFLQFRRVEMENLMQSYEDRLRQARIYPSTLPPSVQKRMDEELSQQQGSHAEGGGS
ncbi:MAG: hypothetical protein MRY64_08085 [Hyphomonadaceae bacterium]|nr:hypothetical protein [Hyphomonadaceae bacterium]